MNEADQLCGRIAIMDKGRILVNDTSAELKKLIPGGNALELRVSLPASEAGGRVLEALRGIAGVAKVDELDAGAPPNPATDELGVVAYRLYAEKAPALVGPATQAALMAGAQIRDLHVKVPSLEDVFIYLTGRHLR
jgi:ABC-2 type transport system ATP-binding protein